LTIDSYPAAAASAARSRMVKCKQHSSLVMIVNAVLECGHEQTLPDIS
jgi:hypothetical protein